MSLLGGGNKILLEGEETEAVLKQASLFKIIVWWQFRNSECGNTQPTLTLNVTFLNQAKALPVLMSYTS